MEPHLAWPETSRRQDTKVEDSADRAVGKAVVHPSSCTSMRSWRLLCVGYPGPLKILRQLEGVML
jgi:hypothetical protein